MLKHPYERQPENCKSAAITMASDCVLTSNYDKLGEAGLATADRFGLPEGEAFEWYAHRIEIPDGKDGRGEGEKKDSGEKNSGASGYDDNGTTEGNGERGEDSRGGDGTDADGRPTKDEDTGGKNGETGNEDDTSSDGETEDEHAEGGEKDRDEETRLDLQDGKADQSELWEEDQMMQERVNELIESINDWGSIKGKLQESIKASTKPRIDYRRAFAGFRASVISTRRHLTRMRPSRRMDFEQMGSVYELSTRLLVAVDVSGSVSREALEHFYGLINRFFKYGIESIDTVQFDAELGEITPLKKAKKEIEVCGRGGTSFQPIIDYIGRHNYDGLVILTDGYAPAPKIPNGFRTPMLWITDNEGEYIDGHEWMEKLPHSRACWLRL